MSEIQQAVQSAKKGDILTYKLDLADNPTNPNEHWHGRIVQIYEDRVTSFSVESIEYPGDTEIVHLFQIVSIDHVT